MTKGIITPGPNAIEEWAKLVKLAPRTERDAEFVANLVFAHLNEDALDKSEQVIYDLEHDKLGYASVLWKRIKFCHTYQISVIACMWLAEFVVSNFGISTMVANYLQYVAHKHGLKKIRVVDIGLRAFPNGFPDNDAWQKLWEAQKVPREFWEQENYSGPDNMLDRIEFMESIKSLGDEN